MHIVKNCRIIIVAGLLLFCGGCGGSSRDRLLTEQLDAIKEAASVLASVKDVASARTAKPNLRDFSERMQNLSKREKNLPVLTPEESTRLRNKFKDRAKDYGKYGEALVRLSYLAPKEVRAEIQFELDALRWDSPQLLLFTQK